MKKVAIIGGGASGFAAAITIARRSKDLTVTIYEKLQKPLKKILVTGNGHCNLTNLQVDASDYFGDVTCAMPVLEHYPPQDTIAFFESMGVLCRADAARRVYPYSNQAVAVQNALLEEASLCGVRIQTECPVETIAREKEGFLLNGTDFADYAVLCAGGSAAPKQGTDGSSYRLLEALGIPVIPPAPALTALVCKDFPKGLKGVRHTCACTLLQGRKTVYRVTGEVQFTEYGLSGIPIMELSRLVAREPARAFRIELDLFPDREEIELVDYLRAYIAEHPVQPARSFVQGFLPLPLGCALLGLCKIPEKAWVNQPALNVRWVRFFSNLKRCTFEISGVRDFSFAQVTAGGADGHFISSKTMESVKIPHLYICGEAYNLDGICGGYNLQWAWASGRCAGDAILKEQTQ